jgi:hypothetical protein
MKKIMLIAGCSHAAGSEIDGTEDSEYNRHHCFGSVLANKLGYMPINLAIAGNTNSGIARSVLKWFEANYNPDEMEVFVLIAWTDSCRIEVPVNREVYLPGCGSVNWLDVTAKQFYRMTMGWEGDPNTPGEVEMTKKLQRFIVENERFMCLMSMNYVLQLQYFLNSKNVNYLMCNSMPLYEKPYSHLGFYISLVDHTKYYGVHHPSEAFFGKYKKLGYENPKAKYWHHDETPHELFAEDLFKFMEENKCL